MIIRSIINWILQKEKKYKHVHQDISWKEMFKIHNIPVEDLSEIKIASCYFKNIDSRIVEYQKKVFEKFNIPLEQHKINTSHGRFLTEYINSNQNAKYFIFFDIDCIPTNPYAFIKILNDIADENTLAGAIQTANHKQNGENIYVGPSFMGFSQKLYKDINIQTLEENENFDVGGIFTYLALANNKYIKYWFPTSVKKPMWFLYPNSFFGIETIYDGLIYHTFQIRLGRNTNKFIKHCKSVIKRYE